MAVADDEVRPSTGEEEGEAPGAAKDKKRRSSVLGALREAIGKVRFLLSFSATRWVLLASAAARTPARRLSFDTPRPGLLEVEGSIVSPSPSSSSSRTSRSASLGTAKARSLSRTSSALSPAAQMKRASSSASSGAGSSPGPSASPGGDDDIDQRADEFIANFYRRLRMERQVSLQLRYVRGNSWDRSP